ncbi:MAG TPA: alpha/beta fold hydrolase [Xanthobacteraceae bacterium]|jgi:polyhydroxyalkanoate synthase|nr:alpha/beta fold hydrolase [Xanthobacteraceae bacterium]
MKTRGDDTFGYEVCRDFAEFVDKAILGTRQAHDGRGKPEPSSVGKKALFLIDEASRVLNALRDKIAAEDEPAAEANTGLPLASAFRGKGVLETLQLIIIQAIKQPNSLAAHYADFADQVLKIFRNESDLKPEHGDHRFKDSLWNDSAFHRILVQLYIAWSQTMQSWLADEILNDDDHKRIGFIFEQIIAAIAPSNLPLNPAALKRARDSDGESAVSGLHNWLSDLIGNHAMPRQIRSDAYEVGRDLALTEGTVIFRNSQLELIQYRPQTPLVYRRPVLLIPPQINKYYIFDLKPKNSLIGHLIHGGLQMFAISWRNPTEAEAHWGLGTYVASTLQVIDVICATTKSRKLGLISACAGGLTAMALIGYLAELGKPLVSSHSLLVTCLFANHGSTLELFTTPDLLERIRRYTQNMGVMQGAELAKVFAWLRPNDLVWRYWINNYLMGRSPPPLDVLYWDNDPTRLPASLNSDFLDMYDKDVFRTPHALKVLDRSIDFSKVKINTYFVGGEDDYLMPWHGCYRAYKVFRGRHRFILSTSGHVQSVLRPPRLANAVYYTNRAKPETPEEWRRAATRHEGSWWDDWHQWLAELSGGIKEAPPKLGSSEFPPLMPAPGSYVLAE